jgi:tetratricopeptide (TPR) repeat protein
VDYKNCGALVPKHSWLMSLLTLAAVCSGQPPAWAYDSFELPASVEQTRIPRRLPGGDHLSPKVDPALLAEIDRQRAAIERLYAKGDYVAAEPIYNNYVQLMEKVAPDDARLAYALLNYGDLLERLHKYNESSIVVGRAQEILARHDLQAMPYALKQWKLGMTLDEFAKLPPPDAAGKVKSICSCDAGQTLEQTSAEDKATEVVQCGYWAVSDKAGMTVPYKMTVAGIECRPDFKFIRDDKAYRLFEISLSFFGSNFENMKQALVSRYDKPQEETVENMKTEMGNIFPLSNLIWDNGVSKIKLTNADGTNVGLAKLRFVHRQLMLVCAKRQSEQTSMPVQRAGQDL